LVCYLRSSEQVQNLHRWNVEADRPGRSAFGAAAQVQRLDQGTASAGPRRIDQGAFCDC
jgi:hypothetical protein